MSGQRVLVIAAHPDDEVLGAGGTIARHAIAGDKVHICIVTEGGYGTSSKEELRRGYLAASGILGAKHVECLGFPDQKLDTFSLTEIINPLEERILKFKPDVVYTHHHGDINEDHKIVFKATMTAARPINQIVKKVLCFEIHSSTEWSPPFLDYSFVPTVYVDISKTIDRKLKAMSAYKSELRPYPHPRSLKAIKITSQREGAKMGIRFAETFALVRDVW